MITHLSIMAKFTPRNLNVEYGLFDFIRDEEDGYSEEIRTAIENLRPSVNNSVQEDDVFQIDCGTEAIAQTILTASLSYNKMLSIGSEEKYPEETFFFMKKLMGHVLTTLTVQPELSATVLTRILLKTWETMYRISQDGDTIIHT